MPTIWSGIGTISDGLRLQGSDLQLERGLFEDTIDLDRSATLTGVKGTTLKGTVHVRGNGVRAVITNVDVRGECKVSDGAELVLIRCFVACEVDAPSLRLSDANLEAAHCIFNSRQSNAFLAEGAARAILKHCSFASGAVNTPAVVVAGAAIVEGEGCVVKSGRRAGLVIGCDARGSFSGLEVCYDDAAKANRNADDNAPTDMPRSTRSSDARSNSNFSLGAIVGAAFLGALIFALVSSGWRLLASQNTSPRDQPSMLAITEAVIGTGMLDGVPTGVESGLTPNFEAPREVVFYVAYRNAMPVTDEIVIRHVQADQQPTVCVVQVDSSSGWATCAVETPVPGTHAFELELNHRRYGTYQFTVTDAQRVFGIVSRAQVTSVDEQDVRWDAPSNVLYGAAVNARLYIEYDNARRGDRFHVLLYKHGEYSAACEEFALQVLPDGSYYCDVQNLDPDVYEFHVLVNGVETNRYLFVVEIEQAPRIVDQPSNEQTVVSPARVITNPDWYEAPDPRRIARRFPARALEARQSGRVVLDCLARSDGRLDCRVAEEDPVGWGFGEAALAAAREFRLRLRQSNGEPIAGRSLRLPIMFHVE